MANQADALTFEAIDKHINEADLSQFEAGGKHHVMAAIAANPAAALQNICGIYKVIKPILQGVLLIPFVPASWKKAIQLFIQTMDSICP
ncbi:MAG: hypothetical protein ABIR47_06440 [Candidatus Kapaibacterium sp.]